MNVRYSRCEMNCLRISCFVLFAAVLVGCAAAQRRGISGSAYVSTARPAVSFQAKNMPVLARAEGTARPMGGNMVDGLPTRVWLVAYGDGKAKSPVALAAHAEVPHGWYWDGIMRRTFSVNEGVEIVNNMEFQACTYIVDGARDPFTPLVAGVEQGAPARWIARGFAARTNFYTDKIILEYREPLPEDIVSLSAMPMGLGDFVSGFEQRARESFVEGPVPSEVTPERLGYSRNIQWRYMNEKFLGTASKYENFTRR
jgi:hypothetical protein